MYKYTCVNTDPSVLIKDLKKTPIRRRKKIIKTHCSNAMRSRIYSACSSFIPSIKEQQANAMRSRIYSACSFIPPIKEQKASLKDVLQLINKIFLINKNVKLNAYSVEITNLCCRCWQHKNKNLISCPESDHDSCRFENTIVDYDLRDKEYSRKTACIKTAIGLIKYNNLPIQYWKNKWIVYFEYRGRQVSFHDPKEQIICPYAPKNWCGIKNKKIPFIQS